MSDTRFSEGIADITHAVQVRAVGTNRLEGITAPDGGPLYVLTLVGECRCGSGDELERTMLLRDTDLVNVVAGLADAARQTALGDNLADQVETVIEMIRDRLGERSGRGQVITVCRRCGVGDGPCDCAPWTVTPEYG
jgi:hypothetical protein